MVSSGKPKPSNLDSLAFRSGWRTRRSQIGAWGDSARAVTCAVSTVGVTITSLSCFVLWPTSRPTTPYVASPRRVTLSIDRTMDRVHDVLSVADLHRKNQNSIVGL